MSNYENLALINSVLGGFSFAFLSALITSDSKKKVQFWLTLFATISAISFLLCALGWTLFMFDRSDQGPIVGHHQFLVRFMILGLMTIFVTIGLSGWNQDKKTGILTSIVAALGLIILIFGILSRYITL